MEKYLFILVLLTFQTPSSLAKEITAEDIAREILNCDNKISYCLSKTERIYDTIYIYSKIEITLNDFNSDDIENYAWVMLNLGADIKNSIDSTLASVGLQDKSALFTKNKINDIFIYTFRNSENKAIIWIDRNLNDNEIKKKAIEYGYIIE